MAAVRDATTGGHDHGESCLSPRGVLANAKVHKRALQPITEKHVIRAASTTQPVIALCREESEFHAKVRGTATSVGVKNIVRDYGKRLSSKGSSHSGTLCD